MIFFQGQWFITAVQAATEVVWNMKLNRSYFFHRWSGCTYRKDRHYLESNTFWITFFFPLSLLFGSSTESERWDDQKASHWHPTRAWPVQMSITRSTLPSCNWPNRSLNRLKVTPFPARFRYEFSHLLHAGPKPGFGCKDAEGVSELKAGKRSQLSARIELPPSTSAPLPSGL